jgi:hypothetical protein
MALNLAAIADHVNELNSDIKLKTALAPATAQFLASSIIYGVKYKEAINKSATTIVLQDEGCDVVPQSNTALSQRVIEVASLTVANKLCIKEMEKKWLGQFLSQGSDYTELAFGEKIVEDHRNEIAKALEAEMWKGTKTGASKILGYVNIPGLNQHAGAALTLANVVEELQKFVNAVPAQISEADDFFVAVGDDVAKLYRTAMANKNIYQATDDKTIFGTSAQMFVTNGLRGSNKAYAGRKDNTLVATDGVGEFEKAEVIYDNLTKNFIIRFTFKLGVDVAFVEESYVATFGA